jgi:hypothetical protein
LFFFVTKVCSSKKHRHNKLSSNNAKLASKNRVTLTSSSSSASSSGSGSSSDLNESSSSTANSSDNSGSSSDEIDFEECEEGQVTEQAQIMAVGANLTQSEAEEIDEQNDEQNYGVLETPGSATNQTNSNYYNDILDQLHNQEGDELEMENLDDEDEENLEEIDEQSGLRPPRASNSAADGANGAALNDSITFDEMLAEFSGRKQGRGKNRI